MTPEEELAIALSYWTFRLRAQTLAIQAGWKEDNVNRDKFGRFTSKKSSGGSRSSNANNAGALQSLRQHIKPNLPPAATKAFNGVLDATKGAGKAVGKAAINAGRKTLKYAKKHPTEVAVGVAAAIGLALTVEATGAAIAGNVAFGEAVAEYMAAEEGAMLSAEAESVKDMAEAAYIQLSSWVNEAKAAGILAETDVVAPAQELAKNLAKPFHPVQNALIGLYGTALGMEVAYVGAEIVKEARKQKAKIWR